MALPHHRRTPSAPPSASSRRPVAVVTAAVALLCILSLLLTAPRHAPTSPSAQRVTSLLSLTSLSSPLDRDDDPASSSPSPALAYRRQLEQATSKHYLNATSHWFDHVYVLSLPSRDDRRHDMRRLADALGIQVEFVDAADKHEPFIKWIAEQVVQSRALRRKEMVRPPPLSRRLAPPPRPGCVLEHLESPRADSCPLHAGRGARRTGLAHRRPVDPVRLAHAVPGQQLVAARPRARPLPRLPAAAVGGRVRFAADLG